MTDKEVMQMALDALAEPHPGVRTNFTDAVVYREKIKATVEALRTALAKPEPDYEAEFIKDWNEGKVKRVSDGKRMVPEREWAGLTNEELQEISEFHFHGVLSGREFYDDIEAKLKEKNS